jgi:hypothetical protein
MAVLRVRGGDFARDKESSYFMGSFRVRPRGSREFILLGLAQAESLEIDPHIPPVAFYGAAGAATGAYLGAVVAGPIGAIVGAIINGANEANTGVLANRVQRNLIRTRYFTVRFKDGRRLKGMLKAEPEVLDRMQYFFEAGRTPKPGE